MTTGPVTEYHNNNMILIRCSAQHIHTVYIYNRHTYSYVYPYMYTYTDE